MLILDGIYTLDHRKPASIRYRIAVAQGAGGRTLTLKNPFRDGTTHVLFSPQDFSARLAAVVPRPRVNLTRYHGVFAPSSPMRRAIVPTPANFRQRRQPNDLPTAENQHTPTEPPIHSIDPHTAPLSWAQRLQRVFKIDITLCPFCGGQLRLIADITNPELIRKILDHVNSRAPPYPPPRRAGPHQRPPNLTFASVLRAIREKTRYPHYPLNI